MAVLAEHRRHGLVKERKIEVRDIHKLDFGVVAFLRAIVADGATAAAFRPAAYFRR